MKRIIFYLVLVMFLNSCGVFYVPGKFNTPLLTDKNQKSLSLATGISGLNLQVAYSPTKNIELISNIAFAQKDTNQTYNNLFLAQTGIGYYKKINTNLLVDAILGIGMGNTNSAFNSAFSDSIFHLKSNYYNTFLQTNLSYIKQNFASSISAKFNLANISYSSDFYNDIPNPFLAPTIEFAYTIIMGYKFIFFNLQAGYCFMPETIRTNIPLILNFGITFKL